MCDKEETTKPFGIARLSWIQPGDWFAYADGYKRAAQLLIKARKLYTRRTR